MAVHQYFPYFHSQYLLRGDSRAQIEVTVSAWTCSDLASYLCTAHARMNRGPSPPINPSTNRLNSWRCSRNVQARHRDLKGLTFALGDLTVYSEVVYQIEHCSTEPQRSSAHVNTVRIDFPTEVLARLEAPGLLGCFGAGEQK